MAPTIAVCSESANLVVQKEQSCLLMCIGVYFFNFFSKECKIILFWLFQYPQLWESWQSWSFYQLPMQA